MILLSGHVVVASARVKIDRGALQCDGPLVEKLVRKKIEAQIFAKREKHR